MTTIAIIPAHNEEETILESILSVDNQVDEVIVVCDNCSDSTYILSKYGSAIAVESQNNRHKKAGALNQVLDVLLPKMESDDTILVMDADSVLDDGFVEQAKAKIREGYGGVGGTFRGRDGGRYVGIMQRNEYARYARDVRRLKGKALCLTGTAALFSVKALREVCNSRESGKVYDTRVLTEDFELTLALQTAGFRIIAPSGCTLTTEVMETWDELGKQRLRWKRGAVENLIQYGVTKVTAIHWGYQLLSVLGLIVTALYLGTLVLAALIGTVQLYPIILIGTAILCLERFVTLVKGRGIKQALLSLTLLWEFPYDIYLQAIHAKAYVQSVINSERKW